MMNACLIIGAATVILFLLGMLITLQTQNAIQAERIRWQEQQIQTLQQQNPGCGCTGILLLLTITLLLGVLLMSVAAIAAGLA